MNFEEWAADLSRRADEYIQAEKKANKQSVEVEAES